MLKIKIFKKKWVMENTEQPKYDPYESHVLIINYHLSFKSTTLISFHLLPTVLKRQELLGSWFFSPSPEYLLSFHTCPPPGMVMKCSVNRAECSFCFRYFDLSDFREMTENPQWRYKDLLKVKTLKYWQSEHKTKSKKKQLWSVEVKGVRLWLNLFEW